MSNLFDRGRIRSGRLLDNPSTVKGTDLDPTITNVAVMVRDDPTYGTYRTYADGTTQGRVITANRLRSNGLTMMSGALGIITSIVVPRGKWQMSAFVGFLSGAAAVTVSGFFGGLSLTSAAPALDRLGNPLNGEVWFAQIQQITSITSTDCVVSIAPYIFEPTESTTLNLFASVSFGASTMVSYGWVQAVSVL